MDLQDDENLAGLAHACWSPNSRHVLTTADFQVPVLCSTLFLSKLCAAITVWSLVRKTASYIRFPKLSGKGNLIRSANHAPLTLACGLSIQRQRSATTGATWWRPSARTTRTSSASTSAKPGSWSRCARSRVFADVADFILPCQRQHFPVESEDLVRVKWSPDDRLLCRSTTRRSRSAESVLSSLLSLLSSVSDPFGFAVQRFVLFS